MKIIFNLALICLLLCSTLFARFSYANERELASDGELAMLGIDPGFQCNYLATIIVRTKSADYFDLSPLELEKLMNTARAILSFECNTIRTIELRGITDDTVVFTAKASIDDNWYITTEPPPLEAIALVSQLYEPSFFYLGAMIGNGIGYLDLSGIENSYQFNVYMREMERIGSVLDGDVEQFKEYIISSGARFSSYDLALENYQNILKSVQKLKPEFYDAYKSVFDNEIETLQESFWSSKLFAILDNFDKTTEEVIVEANNFANSSYTDGFKDFVDKNTRSWLAEESSFYIEELDDASLFEVGLAAEFISSLPVDQRLRHLPTTTSTIDEMSKTALVSIASEIDKVYELATQVIDETNISYDDVNTALETGFSLAQEFDDAGFPDHANAVISHTLARIDIGLKEDLQAYKRTLSTLEFNAETAALIQQQALDFESLSGDFGVFKDYMLIAEQTLDSRKQEICDSAMLDAGIAPSAFEKRIVVAEQSLTLKELNCAIYENGFSISGFEDGLLSTTAKLRITDVDGANSVFELKGKGFIDFQDFVIVSQLAPKKKRITSSEWRDYIANITLPPASGKPDANGVRECDRLASDSYDPKQLANGVDFDSEDVSFEDLDRALDACIAAIENDADDARQQFLLGRLLWLAGEQEQAKAFIDLAAQQNYSPAYYYQAEILLGTSEDPDAFIDALHLYQKAGNGGYAPGNKMVRELNPDGLDFFKEIPPPTERELFAGLTNKGGSATAFGFTKTEVIVSVDIRECFQISATDFSCEYKPKLKCGMSSQGWGNSSAHTQLMSWAMQTDCNAIMEQFKTFRKVGEGEWRQIAN